MATDQTRIATPPPFAAQFEVVVCEIVESLGGTGGDVLFGNLTRRLGETLGADLCFIGVIRPDRSAMDLRAAWRADDGPTPPWLALGGTPCALVAEGAVHAVGADVARLFPQATVLAESGFTAYAGVPLRAPDGPVIGVLSALSTRPFAEPQTAARLLKTFAGRIRLELEHLDALEALRAGNAALRAARDAEAAADARFRDIAALSSDWFWETDADHRFTFISDTIFTVGGVKPESHIGKTREELIGDRVHPDDRPTLAALRATLDAHQPFRNVTYRYAGPTGARWVRISGGPVFDGEGRFTGYRGVGGDISELREAQEMAMRSAQTLRDGVDAMSAGFALFDAEDRLILCNEPFRSLRAQTGMAQIEQGMTFEQIVRGHVAQGVYDTALARTDGEAMVEQRMARHRNPDGRPWEIALSGGRWVEIAERRTADGGTVIVRNDITALKNAERRLLDAIESVPVGFMMCDPDDNLVIVNQRYRDLYPELAGRLKPGVAFAELCELCGDVVDADGRAMVFDVWLRKRLERHRNPTGPVQTVTLSGRNILVWESRTSDGGYVAAHVDISAQILLQERLAQETGRAGAALEARSQFLANMSHELRTPLNAIIGFAELIRMETKGPLDPRYIEFADMIKQAGGFLLSLIVDILDMSKLEAGAMTVHQSAVEPLAAVTEAVSMLSLQARKKGVRLKVALPADAPRVWVERRRLIQIMQNLVSNAVKFTAAGHVRIFGAVEGAMLRLSVADTGRGMTPEEIEISLTPFQQVRRLDRVESLEGTGLGLPLVKALVEVQGGALCIESAVGVGTTVSVTLPLATSDAACSADPEVVGD